MFQRRYAVALALVLMSAATGWGDIYRWDTGEVIPGTEGITPTTQVNLRGKDLAYADFIGANLTGANLMLATLSQADFTDAVIKEAWLGSTTRLGFTPEQLYSTASYQQGDLSGIGLWTNNLAGWNFAGKDLTNVDFGGRTFGISGYGSHLPETDFAGANLTNAGFWYTNLSQANLAGANLTGAYFREATVTDVDFTDAVVRMTIFNKTAIQAEQLYSTASYQQGDLSGIELRNHDLSGWDFTGKNLTDACFFGSTLTDTDFTDAVVRMTIFYKTGLTAEQLYSTASYQQGDLSGIRLDHNDLAGWDFAGKDLTDAYLGTLTNADLTDAVIRGASFGGLTAEQLYSTASYQQGDLSGIRLSDHDSAGWDFAGKDLSNAVFMEATLTGADFSRANLTDANFQWGAVAGANFTGAIVKGANLLVDITAEQLYSTASYRQRDLSGIVLSSSELTVYDLAGMNLSDAFLWGDFTGADFSGANLAGSDWCFVRPLTGADFSGANLADAAFCREGSLSRAVLDGADLRGAYGVENDRHVNIVGEAASDSQNMIRPTGEVHGLDLTGEVTVLTVRDHELPVSVSDNFLMNDDSLLQLILSDATWESNIRLAADVTPVLGGTLALALSPSADLVQMAGHTFDLFDWSGVLEPTNVFSRIQLPDGRWDVHQLYVTGEVVLTALPGDANGDLEFNQLDIAEVLAAGKYLSGQSAGWDEGDWNNDGLFNQLDIVAAQQAGLYLTGPYAGVQPNALASVPEPSSLLLLGVGLTAIALRRYRVRMVR